MIDPSVSPRRSSAARAVGVAWLVLISAFTLVNYVSLFHVSADSKAVRGDHTELLTLQERVSAVEHTVGTPKRQPAAVSPAMLEATRSALDERLAPLEQFAKTAAPKDDVIALQERLSALEARQRRLKSTQHTPEPAPSGAALTQEPPFRVLGLEWRGGERFLSVAPVLSSALGQVSLVRVGERLTDLPGDWRLEALDGTTAVFRGEGRPVRIGIP